MVRLLCLLTGARKEELRQVLCSFLALFFLLISYYLIKPLRNSQFLKEFNPSYQPIFYLIIPFISFWVTKVFNYFSDRMDKYKLIIRVYLIIIASKVAFTWILMYGGKPATVLFYFWGSTYFLLALPTLWACFNDTFEPNQGERFFGFVALGSTFGAIAGSTVSDMISASPAIRPYATLAAAASMSLALLFLVIATSMRKAREQSGIGVAKTEVGAPDKSFWGDVRGLVAIPYVRSIAIMVACLACFTTSLDFLSNQQIDRQLSLQQYHESFPDLGEEGYEFIYGLKSEPKEWIPHRIEAYESQHHVSGIAARYPKYQDDLEGKTRQLFSQVALWQNVVGVFALMVVARFVFRYLGLRIAVLILPTAALLGLAAFGLPLSLGVVEFILVISGALNYALNNAAKEILYTATSEETKFKHKPLIEGPFMRLGDVTASLLKLGLGALAGYMAWGVAAGDRIFLGITFVLTLVWWKCIGDAGRTYDEKKLL